MRKTLCASALVMVALLGAGCKKGPDVVGKWNSSANGGNLDFEFKDDKTFTMGVKAGQMAMSMTGDYKVEGEKMTLTMKDLQMPGMPPQLLAQAKKSPEFGKPSDVTVKFPSEDEMTLSGLPGSPVAGKGATQSLTLKRVKE